MSTKAPKKTLSDLKAAAQKGLSTIDVNAIKDKAAVATSTLAEKAGELKDAAVDVKDDIAAKLTELDRMLQESVTEYNDAYTIMNDKGVRLYIERCRSLDSISFVESLVNSIANRPKNPRQKIFQNRLYTLEALCNQKIKAQVKEKGGKNLIIKNSHINSGKQKEKMKHRNDL